jgi:hypothetical protein
MRTKLACLIGVVAFVISITALLVAVLSVNANSLPSSLNGWAQVNVSGFGNTDNMGVTTLAVFSNTLYAGTQGNMAGAEIWRTSNGNSWTSVITSGFGVTQNNNIRGLTVWGNYLYAGTSNDNGAQIWRSNDGLSWTQVVSQGLGNANSKELNLMYVFSNTL